VGATQFRCQVTHVIGRVPFASHPAKCPSGCWLDQSRTAQGLSLSLAVREVGSAVAPTQAFLSLTLKGYNTGAGCQVQITKDRKLFVGRSDNTCPVSKRKPTKAFSWVPTLAGGFGCFTRGFRRISPLSYEPHGGRPLATAPECWSAWNQLAGAMPLTGCAVCFTRITSLTL